MEGMVWRAKSGTHRGGHGARCSARLGYQPDPTAAIAEARRLLAEAGHAKGLKSVDFMVRELPHHKLWSVAIQALLKETLHIETTMRTVQTSVWFDEAQAGNFDLTISAIVSMLLDPVDAASVESAEQ